jgi:hypothetical protein
MPNPIIKKLNMAKINMKEIIMAKTKIVRIIMGK